MATDPHLHPKFERDRNLFLEAAKMAEPGMFVFGVGPSGVGKSVMDSWMLRQLAGTPDQWTKGGIPAIAVRASRAEKGYFSSKDFHTRLVMGLRQPNFDWLEANNDVDRENLRELKEDQKESQKIWKSLKLAGTEHELRREFESHAPARGLRWVLVREGASICGTHRGKLPSDYIMSYMEMAEETNTVWLIFGVARMSQLWQAHSEVRRRSTIVHIDRYREIHEDFEPMAQLIKTISAQYKFSAKNLVADNLDMVQATSAGVYGEIAAFFRRADMNRIRDGRETISKGDLNSSVYNEPELQTLWADIRDFDRLIKAPDCSDMKRNIRLGWKKDEER